MVVHPGRFSTSQVTGRPTGSWGVSAVVVAACPGVGTQIWRGRDPSAVIGRVGGSRDGAGGHFLAVGMAGKGNLQLLARGDGEDREKAGEQLVSEGMQDGKMGD